MKFISLIATQFFACLSLMFSLAVGTANVEAASMVKAGLNFFTSSQSPTSIMAFSKYAGSGSLGKRPTVVFNIEQLYAAINDPLNAGAQIALAPGIYFLSANGPGGVPRPNGGRLELQEDMSLQGSAGDREAVVIDASDLPLTSYQLPALTGAIRIGRGSNRIEWLTVRQASNGSANIESDLIWPGTAYIRIAHIASTGSVRGVDIRNLGAPAAGAVIVTEIEDNDLYSNRLSQAEGLRLGNNLSAHGAVVLATLSGNRFYDNYQGLLVENNRTNNAIVSVVSLGDSFFENGAGVIMLTGLSFAGVPANGNTINFTAYGSRFENNNGFTIFDRGGVFVVGGENTSVPNGTSNNTAAVGLYGCVIVHNQMQDLGVFGARSNPDSIGLPGTNNRVTISGFFPGRGITLVTADSIPDYPGGMNAVTFVH